MADMRITRRELSDAQLTSPKDHIDVAIHTEIEAPEGRLCEAITRAIAPPPPKFGIDDDDAMADLTLDDRDDDEG